MAKIMISLSADGYKKGDRCVVKAGRGEWFVGTIRTSGAKLGIDFDDGAKATVDAEDFKDVKVVGPKAKKTKATLSTQEAKAFREKYPASVIVPKAKVTKDDKPTKAKIEKPTKAKAPSVRRGGVPVIEGFEYVRHGQWPEAQALCVLFNQFKDKGYNLGPKTLRASNPMFSTVQGASGFHENMLKMGFKVKGKRAPNGTAIYTNAAAEFTVKARPASLAVICTGANGFDPVTKAPDDTTYWTRFGPSGLTQGKRSSATPPKAAKTTGDLKRPPNVPKAGAAPVNKAAKTTSAMPDTLASYPSEGYVFSLSNQAGEFVVNEVQYGRALTTVKYYMLNAPKGRGLWTYKLRHSMGHRMRYTYLRKATQAELDEANGSHKNLLDRQQARIDTNKAQGNALGISIGDVVGVHYTDSYTLQPEIVTDINHKTGKVAISTWRDRRGKKRRFIHMQNVKSIVMKGPGYYDPNNQAYSKY